MKLTLLVTMERVNEFDGKRGHVVERILTLQDTEKYAGKQCPDTFDYTLSKDEEVQHPPESLTMKRVTFGAEKVEQWNGRMKIRGAIGEVDGKAVTPGAPPAKK